MHFIRSRCARAASVLALAALGACTALRFPGGLPPGTPIAEARRTFGGPSAEYPLANGGTRLEFRQGSFGKQTYMLDFDASGRLVATQQVLTPATFATIAPGMTQEQVLARIGTPAFVFPVGWQRLQVWNYRFDGGDCVWYQVSIAATDRRVVDANIGTDPACDGPNSRE